MPVCPPHIVRWVSLHVVPQERKVRGALRRNGISENDIDDLIQDAYCRFTALKSVDHIDQPGAYFMQMVKNAWRDNLRRARIVCLEDFTENAPQIVEDEGQGIEATIFARDQLKLIDTLLGELPERCRTIFTLKRVEGLSQREIARRLAVSEHVVENDVQKALRAIQAVLRGANEEQEDIKSVDQRRRIG